MTWRETYEKGLNSRGLSEGDWKEPVPYKQLTLPTKRIAKISDVAV